jgi:GTP-binding protein HflX
MKKALLIDISPPQITTKRDLESKQYELEELVKTYAKFEVSDIWIKKSDIDLKLFLRKGLLDELILHCRANKVTNIVLGNILKPRQIWDLSEFLRKEKIVVWDRIDIILNIFSQHSISSESKLQIQLAKIRHMGPRIFGMGDELSRQGGGSATTRGIGETNTEIMKRHLRREELSIEKKLEKIKKSKALQRLHRKRMNKESVALIGYTNAGKSSVMNLVSKKGVVVKDALFQTLDTRIGKIFLPKTFKEIFISDTIGFISDLPPKLIASFQSTLSESIYSDVLLHVIDVSDKFMDKKINIVNSILEKLDLSETKQILIFNKIDKLDSDASEDIILEYKKQYSTKPLIFISAQKKENIENLKLLIEKVLFE